MEEIREVALAYYANGSEEVKQVAKSFFEAIDTDGDGKVSVGEFEEYLRRWRRYKPALFAELDKDGDGFLDFEEALVFYYMVKLRNSFCDGCGEFLKGVYFTCVDCFFKSSNKQPYDLCLSCYRTAQFSHHHQVFLDNYAMLNSIWSGSNKADSQDKAFGQMLEGANLVIDVAGIVSNSECSII